jgi:molybdopterin synthase catalytic subunit
MYLTTETIELAGLVTQVEAPDCGGVACFLGMVRNHQAGREVVQLEYSAYEAMAEAECASIVREAEARWSCTVALRHRIGTLEVGDTAVAVAAAARHRDAAFAACRFVIEEVKRRVPIWKKEYFRDGTVEWVCGGAVGERGSGEVEAKESAASAASALLELRPGEAPRVER